MQLNLRRMRSSITIGLLIILVGCGQDTAQTKERALPILGHKDLDIQIVDGKEVTDTIYHVIPDFAYLNQDSIMFSSKEIKGKIWISDFFFTHCPSICPTMTSQMKRLNTLLKDLEDEIEFLSFSIDPDRDQPSRMTEYINNYGIEASNWNFLTGNEAATHRLGVEDFLVHAQKDNKAPGGYAHSEGFTLVDREGRVRGVYLGTVTEEVDKLEKDVRKLLEIEYGIKGKE